MKDIEELTAASTRKINYVFNYEDYLDLYLDYEVLFLYLLLTYIYSSCNHCNLFLYIFFLPYKIVEQKKINALWCSDGRMVFRCSVASCTKSIEDQMTFFDAKKIANFDQLSNGLFESKTQKNMQCDLVNLW